MKSLIPAAIFLLIAFIPTATLARGRVLKKFKHKTVGRCLVKGKWVGCR